MDYKPSNIQSILKGKIGNLLNTFVSNKEQEPGVHGYTLIKDLTPIYSTVKERVGIYKNKAGKKVVIKKYSYTLEDLNAVYLKNEASVLHTIPKLNNKNSIAPKFIELIQNKNQTALVTEFVDGTQLDSYDKETQVVIIKKVYESLATLSLVLKKNNFKDLPRRNSLLYMLTFPINLLKLLLKDPQNVITYIQVTFQFYFNYTLGALSGIESGIAHRDLYADNIFYNKEKESITVLDWESAAVTDSLYDLSQIAMIYSKSFKTEDFIDFLNLQLNTNSERRRFIGLSIFNSVQILGNIDMNHEEFSHTKKFLLSTIPQVSPKILVKKSPFETINSLTLDLIYLFYKVTGLPIINASKKIILCYHSVGNDGWRFSTRVKLFKDHIEFLKSKYKLTPISDLISSNKGGVNVSFDDGYENVVTNALPILEQAQATSTMFVLGSPEKANRTELDNPLKIMSKEQVHVLKNKGWEIGYHTNTHANLGKLNDAELNSEIVDGKKNAEAKLGFALRYFAYPKGIFSPKIVEYVRKAGFKNAFTVDGQDVHMENDPLLLDRVPIEGELTANQLAALMSPLGIKATKLFMKILVFKENHLS